MGFRSVRVSDISGFKLDEKEAVNVAVREHPTEETRQFDASLEELKANKSVRSLISKTAPCAGSPSPLWM